MEEQDLGARSLPTVVPSGMIGWNPGPFKAGFTSKPLLVVDDEEDIHLMLEDRLEAMGYEIVTATNGVEALSMLAQCSVRGILLDLEMPVMDGLTLLRELRRLQIQVPVIVMSAEGNPQKFIKAMKLGAMDCLHKPLDAVLFTQKCRQVFE